MIRRVIRRLLMIVLAVVVVLAVSGSAFWWWAARRAEAMLLVWAAQQREAGWTVSMSPPRPGGWPLSALARVSDFHVTAGAAAFPEPVGLSAANASFGVELSRPRLLLVHFDGDQTIQLGAGPVVPFTAARTVLTLPIDAEMPPQQGDLAIDALRVSLPGAGSPVAVDSLRGHLDFHPEAGPGRPGLGFSLTVGPVLLPTPSSSTQPGPPLLKAMGPRIDSVVLEGAVNGPIPRTRYLVPWLTAWRDGGGTVTLSRGALNWGRLMVTGSATAALDKTMQPAGTATARLTGFGETLDALAEVRVLPPQAATAAKAVLSLMARPQETGPPVVEVPLALQGGTLQLGRIPLARMPALQWSTLQ